MSTATARTRRLSWGLLGGCQTPWGSAGCASAGQAGRLFSVAIYELCVCMHKNKIGCNVKLLECLSLDPFLILERPSLPDGVAPVSLRTCASIHPRTGFSANSDEQCKYAAITQQDQASVRCAPPIGHLIRRPPMHHANVHATLGTWPDSSFVSRPQQQ